MTILWILLSIICVQLALALGLIDSQHPVKNLRGEGLDFQRLPEGLPEMPSQTYTARDGTKLPLRHFPCQNAPMLNLMRIRLLNGLAALQLRFPDAVLNDPLGHTATRAYSYRLMHGFNPRAASLKDIAALPDFTLIAGTQDEAFHAEHYAKTMSAASDKGSYHRRQGLGHLDVVNAPETYALIKAALA